MLAYIDFEKVDRLSTNRLGNWGNGTYDYTLPFDGYLFIQNSSREFYTATLNGIDIKKSISAAGEVVNSSEIGPWPLKKGDHLYIYYYDGSVNSILYGIRTEKKEI